MICAFSYGFTADATQDTPMRRLLLGINGIRPLFFEWHQDIAKLIREQYDGSGLILMGHSFGGSAMLKAAPKLIKAGITPCQMILFDPVPWRRYWLPILGWWFRPKWQIPEGVPATVLYRVDEWGDAEWIDGHPVKGADNWQVGSGHSEIITDPDILARANNIIQACVAERAIHAQLRTMGISPGTDADL